MGPKGPLEGPGDPREGLGLACGAKIMRKYIQFVIYERQLLDMTEVWGVIFGSGGTRRG